MHSLILRDAIIPHPKNGIYFDFTKIINSYHLNAIATKLYDLIKPFSPDAIIGSGYGGTQICGAITSMFYIPSIIVRSEPHKVQGNRQIEGDIKTPKRLVFIDDTIYTGKSLRTLIKIIGEDSKKLVGAAVLYDDWRPLGTRQIEQELFPIKAVVSRMDIGMSRDKTPNLSIDEINSAIIRPINLNVKNLLWTDYDGNKSHWPMKSSPIFHKDLVINAVDDYKVSAYRNGEIVWRYQFKGSHLTDKGIVQDLKIINGILYIGSYDGSIVALNAEDGLIIWEKKLDSNIHSTPIFHKGVLYVNTESYQKKIKIPSGTLTALEAKTGKILWRHQHDDFSPSTVTIFKNSIIANSNDGTIKSFSFNGDLQWTYVTNSPVKINLLVDKKFLYFVDDIGYLYKINAESGIEEWKIPGCKSGWMVTPIKLGNNIICWDAVNSGDARLHAYNSKGQREYLHKFRDPIAGIIKINETDAIVFSRKSQIAYISQSKKLWEKHSQIPFVDLVASPSLNQETKQIAFNFKSGGLQVYNYD